MGSVKRTHQLIRVIGKIWYIATNNITTRLGKLAAQHRVIHAPFSIRHFPFSRISNGVWHMPDIYPLRNDHKHKFLDLESRINARRANLYKLSFREQLDAPNAFFYSRSSKGRLVSLSVMADDVSRSRDPSFKHLSSPIEFNFLYTTIATRTPVLMQSNWHKLFALAKSRSSEFIYNTRHEQSVLNYPHSIYLQPPHSCCSRLPFTSIIRSNTHLS